MVRIELQLDEQTVARACQLAASRRLSLDDLVKELIEQQGFAAAGDDPFLGMFANEPELVDQVTEWAMEEREGHLLRHDGSG